MIYVRLLLSEQAQDQELIRLFSTRLPVVIADAFCSDDGWEPVELGDVIVDGAIFRPDGGLRIQPPQAVKCDVNLVVFSQRLPKLGADVDELASWILAMIKEFAPTHLTIRVSVLPQNGGHAERKAAQLPNSEERSVTHVRGTQTSRKTP